VLLGYCWDIHARDLCVAIDFILGHVLFSSQKTRCEFIPVSASSRQSKIVKLVSIVIIKCCHHRQLEATT